MKFAAGNQISDDREYLEKMSKPLMEKLKIIRYIPKNAKKVLDIGCADGTVTVAMARLFPWIEFHGIDLNEEFVSRAKKNSKDIKNVKFETIYLRDLLSRSEKYDVAIFCSVLHEFFTYGEGISSVVKALADAHELLSDEGVLIIRDMILHEYTKHANFQDSEIVQKIKDKKDLDKSIKSFEERYGSMDTHYEINHFLLKYMYSNNWERELMENYVAITFEQYETIFDLLGIRTQYKESFLIEFLKNMWKKDFGFVDDELLPYKSTGILVGKKETEKVYK